MNETELKMLELLPKVEKYCTIQSEDYKCLIDIVAGILRAIPVLISFRKEIVGFVNYAYVFGIEHQRKQQIMQAFLSAEEKEK